MSIASAASRIFYFFSCSNCLMHTLIIFFLSSPGFRNIGAKLSGGVEDSFGGGESSSGGWSFCGEPGQVWLRQEAGARIASVGSSGEGSHGDKPGRG